MNILFVCTGNTSRSIMAEYIFNNINNIKGLSCKSAGISIVAGSVATKNSVNIIRKELRENIDNREAVQLKDGLLKDADLVLTMTAYGREYIKEYFSKYGHKVYTLAEYVGEDMDVTDPYGGSLGVYEKTYKEIKGLIDRLVHVVKKEESV
ncbi:MAG: low molecular weight protein arginine phosphatase [Clostridium sp.]